MQRLASWCSSSCCLKSSRTAPSSNPAVSCGLTAETDYMMSADGYALSCNRTRSCCPLLFFGMALRRSHHHFSVANIRNLNPQPRKKTGKILVVTGQAYENIRQNTQRVLPPIKPETNTFQAAHDTDRHISDALRRHPRRSPGYSYGSARLFSRVPIFTHNRHTDNFFTPAE